MWEAAADKLPCVSCQSGLDSETLPQIPNKKGEGRTHTKIGLREDRYEMNGQKMQMKK